MFDGIIVLCIECYRIRVNRTLFISAAINYHKCYSRAEWFIMQGICDHMVLVYAAIRPYWQMIISLTHWKHQRINRNLDLASNSHARQLRIRNVLSTHTTQPKKILFEIQKYPSSHSDIVSFNVLVKKMLAVYLIRTIKICLSYITFICCYRLLILVVYFHRPFLFWIIFRLSF